MKRFLNHILPAPLRLFARRFFYFPFDTYETILGKRPNGVPPRGIFFISYDDYVKQGEKYLSYFKELCGLHPSHAVLDVGCGIGRIAVPLTRFLNEKGTYDGFDAVKSGIDWCNKNISAKHPNFHFQYTGLYTHLYNTSDTTDAINFVFPYEAAKFDFVFLTSVFTHLMPAEIENYITETGRVMKPGASCLISLYIVNCESEDLMIRKAAQINFPFNKGFFRLSTLNTIDRTIAYDEEWLLEKLSNSGLKMGSIQYGQWCGRKHFLDYQDLLICRKI